MTSLFSTIPDAQVRSVCREKIESLEHWLRRLIDDSLSPAYGDYFEYADTLGNRLLKSAISKDVEARRAREPKRYPRKIDAVLLEDAIDIVCKPELYRLHFSSALKRAFPNGRDEARAFLLRILAPRNNLAHANSISNRAAEQIVCYSNDVIDSIREHYRDLGMQQEYDVPLILRITDSFGQTFTRAQCMPNPSGGIYLDLTGEKHLALRPGDLFSIDVEADPAYDTESYNIVWTSSGGIDIPIHGRKISLLIKNAHVRERFDLQCRLTTNKEWHRMQQGIDDFLFLVLKVLPPL